MLISRADIQDLKSRVDIVAVIGKHVPLKKRGKYYVGRCPFHGGETGERTPSLIVDPQAGLYNCLGACRTKPDEGGGRGSSGGDALTFVMRFLNVDFREAGRVLGLDVQIGPPKRNGRAPEAEVASASSSAYLARLVDHWHQELSINRRAQEYLESRGLVTKEIWRAMKIGYSSGSVEDLAAPADSEPFRQLVELGVLNDSGKEHFKGRLVFPLLALDQRPVGVYGRAVGPQEPRHLFLPGPRHGLFNGNAAKRSKELLLVESVLCVVSLMEAQVGNAVALCGLSTIPAELWELIERYGVESVVLGLDADDAGRRATPVFTEAFLKKGLRVRSIEWPEKDPNQVLVAYGAKRLREVTEKLLAEAVAANPPLIAVASVPTSDDVTEEPATRERNTEPEPPAVPPAPLPPAQLTEEELRKDSLLVRYEDRRWDVLWLESPSPAHLRARLRLDLLPEAADDGAVSILSFLDTLNLLAARARESFVKRALALLPPGELPPDSLSRLIQNDLIRLADLGEERRKALARKPESPAALSPERRSRALEYLGDPHLLARLASDLDAMGYVGEGTAKLLGYLVAISRKLPEAMSMVILSSSGSGKSALAEVLERLTPEEDLLVVSRFTAASLYWMGKDALKRKFVSIEERSGSEEADYAIRALQSKKQLTLMAPIKDQATGKIETKLFLVEGPTSFLESTTESQIHYENATRCFETRLDESPEQTKRIHQAQRRSKTPEGQRARERAGEIAARHRDVQRCLRTLKVVTPYADLLEFPSAWTRSRRDHPRFLNLIEVLAFLHQYQRPLRWLDTDEPCEKPLADLLDEDLMEVYVEATVEDYTTAVLLYGEILGETLSELKKPLRTFLEAFRQLAEDKGEDEALLSRELRERTKLQQHTVKRYLAELVDLEYVAMARGVRGAAAGYRLVDLGEREKARREGLLSPEELARRIGERA